MAEPRSSGIWIAVVAGSAALMLSLAVVTSDYTRKASVLEAQKIEAELGASTLRKINELAEAWYLTALDWMGTSTNSKEEFDFDFEDFYSEDARQRAREERFAERLTEGFADKFSDNRKLNRWLDERKEALLDLFYWVLRRAALFWLLLPLWIPLVLVSVYDGYNGREIKKTDFGYTSPVLNHWARRVISLNVALTLLVFFVPVAIDPLIFPVIMALITAALSIAVGNIQKRI